MQPLTLNPILQILRQNWKNQLTKLTKSECSLKQMGIRHNWDSVSVLPCRGNKVSKTTEIVFFVQVILSYCHKIIHTHTRLDNVGNISYSESKGRKSLGKKILKDYNAHWKVQKVSNVLLYQQQKYKLTCWTPLSTLILANKVCRYENVSQPH